MLISEPKVVSCATLAATSRNAYAAVLILRGRDLSKGRRRSLLIALAVLGSCGCVSSSRGTALVLYNQDDLRT